MYALSKKENRKLTTVKITGTRSVKDYYFILCSAPHFIVHV